MKLIKKIIFILLLCFIVNSSYAFAEKSDSIKNEIESNKNKIENLEEEKNNVNNKIENEKNELNSLEQEILEKENDIYSLQLEISEYQKEIDSIQNEINELNILINESKNEVKIKEDYLLELKEEQEKIENLLATRLRSVYKLDLAKQYIYLLIKSENIFEIFQNINSISKIISFDKNLIEKSKDNQDSISNEIVEIESKIKEQEENQLVVEEKKSEIIEAKNKVLEIQKEEENKRQELLTLYNDKENNISSLQNNSDKISSEIAELESYNDELEAELDRIINEVSNSTSNNDKVESLPSESGFLRPVSGAITSYYGYRVNPVTGEYKLHKGIDYAGNYGDPIKASKSGVVEYSGWISGYGNSIILSHGNGVQTLYTHAQTLNVSYGQTVAQGDIIATVGSTGNSTGPHLHFEVRINGEAVDPLNYIPY